MLPACAGLLLFGAPSQVHAEQAGGGAEETLARGRGLIEDLRYAQAVEELEVVAANEAAPVGTRLEALEVLGVLHVSRGRQRPARAAFEWLLTLDPGHQLSDPSVTPREEEFFAEVRGSFRPEITATLDVSTPPSVPGDGPVHLEATLGGATSSVVAVEVYFRPEDEMAFSRQAMVCEGQRCTVELPRPSPGEGLVYYAEAQAPSGHPLAEAGSLERPHRIEGAGTLSEPDGQDAAPDLPGEAVPRGRAAWYRSWWFWTIVGVVVVGTTTAVVVTLPAESPPDGNLGSLHLPMEGRW